MKVIYFITEFLAEKNYKSNVRLCLSFSDSTHKSANEETQRQTSVLMRAVLFLLHWLLHGGAWKRASRGGSADSGRA